MPDHPDVPSIETKLAELHAAAQSAMQGIAVCACGKPLTWTRSGSRWEGKCERGHEMGGNLAIN